MRLIVNHLIGPYQVASCFLRMVHVLPVHKAGYLLTWMTPFPIKILKTYVLCNTDVLIPWHSAFPTHLIGVMNEDTQIYVAQGSGHPLYVTMCVFTCKLTPRLVTRSNTILGSLQIRKYIPAWRSTLLASRRETCNRLIDPQHIYFILFLLILHFCSTQRDKCGKVQVLNNDRNK
jgi:hypothetical protein